MVEISCNQSWIQVLSDFTNTSDDCGITRRLDFSSCIICLSLKLIKIHFADNAAKYPWDFYISPDKVPWATSSVPWIIKNYGPWNLTIISPMAHDGVLTRKCTGATTSSPPGILLKSWTWFVYSVPHGTLSEGLRYIRVYTDSNYLIHDPELYRKG